MSHSYKSKEDFISITCHRRLYVSLILNQTFNTCGVKSARQRQLPLPCILSILLAFVAFVCYCLHPVMFTVQHWQFSLIEGELYKETLCILSVALLRLIKTFFLFIITPSFQHLLMLTVQHWQFSLLTNKVILWAFPPFLMGLINLFFIFCPPFF